MPDKLILMVCIFAAGFLTGLSVTPAEAKKETDTQKWERLEQNRIIRRETERKYQMCLKECVG